MSDDSFDELLTAPAPRRRGRPTNEERARRAADQLADAARQAEIRRAGAGMSKIKVEELKFLPVSQNWLAEFFNMDPVTVRKRLSKCRPAGSVGGGRPVYLFHEALPYLIKPKMTAEQFAKTLNKADLPPEVNKAFWDSQRSRVKYKIEAQEAWETEDVLKVLGDVAMTIKDSLVSVVEEMRNRAKLTDEQTELLSAAIDEIRSEIRQKLVDMPAKQFTGSMFGKPMFGISEQPDAEPDIPETGWLEEDEDDE